MRLIIKPDSDDLGLILAAGQYQKMWNQYGAKILQAFHAVTGMNIARTQITARVARTSQSMAGNGTPHHSMRLAASDYRSDEFKLMTMIHELTHRLLTSNGYGAYALKYEGEYDQEIDHRHVYLIEYDVVKEALGDKWATVCVQYENRHPDANSTSPHAAAWKWAMGMSTIERTAKRRELFRTRKPFVQDVSMVNEIVSDEDTRKHRPELIDRDYDDFFRPDRPR